MIDLDELKRQLEDLPKLDLFSREATFEAMKTIKQTLKGEAKKRAQRLIALEFKGFRR